MIATYDNAIRSEKIRSWEKDFINVIDFVLKCKQITVLDSINMV